MIRHLISLFFPEKSNYNSKNYNLTDVKDTRSRSSNIKITKVNIKIIVYFWLFAVIFGYLAYILFSVLNLIYLIIAAFIISIAMETIIQFFQSLKIFKKSIPRIGAVFIAYLLLGIFVLSGFVLVVPFVLDQSIDILKMLIDKVIELQISLKSDGIFQFVKNISWFPGYIKHLVLSYLSDPAVSVVIQNSIQDNIANAINKGSSYIQNFGLILIKALGGFVNMLFSVFMVFIVAIFFTIEKDGVIALIARIFSNSENSAKKVIKLYRQLGLRLKGQLLLCIFIGFAVRVLLWTLSLMPGIINIDLPNKFTLALIAGVFEFIPIIGPVLGAIPALLVVTLTYGFAGFAIIALLYTILQYFENTILVPYVMNNALGTSPLLIFLSMLIGGSVLGFLGIVMAVPFAVIISLMFEENI